MVGDLSPENEALCAAEKLGIIPRQAAGWWHIHEETLNRLLNAARNASPGGWAGWVQAANEVLKPFADAAREHEDEEGRTIPDHAWLYAVDDSLTLGDARRALAVLAVSPIPSGDGDLCGSAPAARPQPEANCAAKPSDVPVKGSVQILCEEIGFPFAPDLERSEVFVRFVGELVAEIDQHASIKRVMAKMTGRTAEAAPEDEVLTRAVEMICAPDDRRRIALAVAVHGLCDERNPDDAYPTNHTIDMLSSCASAIRFGLEPRVQGIGSRHAAEAASHVWKQVYGLTRLDEHTNAWRKSWACGKMAIAAAALSQETPTEEGVADLVASDGEVTLGEAKGTTEPNPPEVHHE